MRLSILLAGVVAALLVTFPREAHGLEIPADLKKRLLNEGNSKPGQSASDEDAPDNSLDPEKYLIGGGDAFQVSIVGLPSEMYMPMVDAEGNLYDGELGFIPLGKIPLSKAIALIKDKVKRSLRRSNDVYVTLRKVKKANITVTGAVAVPGTYQIPGTHRLLDAIKMANSGVLPLLSKCDYRSVTVRNGDSVKSYDLLRFFSKQDVNQNPYIYPGDNLFLGYIDSRIFVSGEVSEPVIGWVPALPGETVGSLISVLNLKRNADSNSILVQQASSPSTQSLKRMTYQEAFSFPLHPNDLVNVSSKDSFRRSDTVKVAGEVKNRGTYPILSSRSSIKSILDLAGGTTELGNRAGIVIIRHRKTDDIAGTTDRQEANAGLKGNFTRPLGSMQIVRPEVNASINDLQASGDYSIVHPADMDDLEILQDGDEIFVPRKDGFVYVSGNVRNPGAYPYVKGAGINHYIDQAKGFTNKADSRNLFLMANYDGVTQIHGSDKVKEGDVIVVPAAIEYKRFTTVYLPLLQIIPGLISLVLTYMILDRQN
ncbi:MAG: Periplasmic polysaccharide export protein [Fibrobacteres bacterium]|nr:Periplasmic polysaccharide export protein [Fibrobacterota bacterium]